VRLNAILPPTSRRWLAMPCLLALFTVVGCGDGTPKKSPVEGKVTVDGKALTEGIVTFNSETKLATPLTIVGTVGVDGSYKMTSNGEPGVPAGKYKATVNIPASAGSGADPSQLSSTPKAATAPVKKFNAKFESQSDTPLVVEVPSANYDLKLTK